MTVLNKINDDLIVDDMVYRPSLTDKWKKGELPAGYYYVKNEFNNIFLSDYSESYNSINDAVIKDFFTVVSEIKEVLGRVPSYEEYQQLLSDQLAKNEGVEINAELEAENAKLKDLLKEANNWLKAFYAYEQSDFVREQVKQCLTKTKQVLGEE